MSATDKKQGINDYWREFGYDSDYESSLDKNKDNNSEEEQEEENEYEEMINQEEYDQNNEGNYYEEQEENGEEEVIENEEMEVENNYENADDQEMKKSSQDEWSKLFNDLDDIIGDIRNMDKSIYLEYTLQDMEDCTKKFQNQYGEEKDGEFERTSGKLKDNNDNIKYMTFSEVVDGLSPGRKKEELQNLINRKEIQSYLGKNNNYTSGGYSNNKINLSSGNNSFVVNDAKVLPKVVFPEEEYHHGWQYYDEWKKSNKRNTALEQAAKDKLKDEIFTYYQYIPSKWKNLAKSAVLKGDLETMNKAINATFAKVTPL